MRRAADTPQWRDPDTGYLRRQISTAGFPAAVTEVTLPPRARVPYPAAAYAFIAQLVWVLSGELTLTDGPVRRVLAAGDTFELGQPRSREFGNDDGRGVPLRRGRDQEVNRLAQPWSGGAVALAAELIAADGQP